jgi:DNA-binding NtrC family response regulator
VLTEQIIVPWLNGIHRAESFPEKLRHGHIIEDMERLLIEKTLRECAGHRAKTAEALGIGVRTLTLKLKQWREQDEARRSLLAAQSSSAMLVGSK